VILDLVDRVRARPVLHHTILAALDLKVTA